jgi:hypothetical protein
MVTVFHKGIRKEGLLKKDLILSWLLDRKRNKSAVTVFHEQYPDRICSFQIIIEISEGNYGTKGLQAIRNNLAQLMENEQFGDLKFVFKDDHIAAHSAIIAASSPVFAAMFEAGKSQEGQTRTVNIEDIDSRVFRKLLQFMYTGSSGSSNQDPSDVLQALYLAADKYQVDALKEICEEYIILKLDIENVLHLLVWAHLYGALKLKEAAVTHMVKQRYRVWKLAEWEEFNKKYPDLFYLVCNRMVHY